MTEPISVVVLSTGLENFKDIRRALTAESRVQLLAGGNDADQLYEEIVRLKPTAAIIALGANSDNAVRFIERLNGECPNTALISAAQNASPEMILNSLRAGAREFLRLPIIADELRTVLEIALGSGRAVGIEITIYNPALDESGASGRELSRTLVQALKQGPSS